MEKETTNDDSERIIHNSDQDNSEEETQALSNITINKYKTFLKNRNRILNEHIDLIFDDKMLNNLSLFGTTDRELSFYIIEEEDTLFTMEVKINSFFKRYQSKEMVVLGYKPILGLLHDFINRGKKDYYRIKQKQFTDEELKERKKAQSKRAQQKRRANMTDEQKQQEKQKRKEIKENKTDEQKQQDRQKDKDKKKIKRKGGKK